MAMTDRSIVAGVFTDDSQAQQAMKDLQNAGYTDQGEQKVRLREEELQANKERVQAGEVGIRKDVVSEEKTLDVPVNREEVYIERHPVSGEVPADRPIGEQSETYRVPVSEER